VEQVIKDDPAIFDRSLEVQVNKLIIDTLHFSGYRRNYPSTHKWPRVLIIDGLDECMGEAQQSHILRIIQKCFIQRKLPYRIILASRPEYAIRTALDSFLNQVYHIKLHEYDASSDMRLYLHRRLRAIGEVSNDPRASDPSWPGVPNVNKLVVNASGQFVYVATAVKFMSHRRASPFLRLQLILSWEPGVEQQTNPFAALDTLYHNILTTAERAYMEDSEDDRSVIDLLRELMLYNQASDLIEMSLSIREFEYFSRLREGQINDMLSDLHSLIKTTSREIDGFHELRIDFHHKSFADYLQDHTRSGAAHRPDHLMYARLLRSSLSWLGLMNHEGGFFTLALAFDVSDSLH
jgi:hypothetical protein